MTKISLTNYLITILLNSLVLTSLQVGRERSADFCDAPCVHQPVQAIRSRRRNGIINGDHSLVATSFAATPIFPPLKDRKNGQLPLHHRISTGHSRSLFKDLQETVTVIFFLPSGISKHESMYFGNTYRYLMNELQPIVIQDHPYINRCRDVLMVSMAALIAILMTRNFQYARKRVKDTEARNAELQLALKALELSNKENIRFSETLAHDIRNPIHAITTIITLMQADKRTVEDQELLSLAKESILKINLMVDDILYRKNGAGVARINRRDCDIAALIRHSVALLRFKAAEKQQKIKKLSLASLYIPVDQDKIWRVLNNVLVNAIKFSPQRATIWVALKVENDHVVISVRDEGIGIPDELHDAIFSGENIVQRKGTMGEDSFGIGLYASNQIVKAHGGTISYISLPQGGTEFVIRLPYRN